MSHAWLALIMTTALAAGAGAQGQTQAQGRDPRREGAELDLARDHFAAGATVLVRTPVAGDLIAAGRRVDVTAPVGGDAVLAGGQVRVDGRVSQDLYAMGGDLEVLGAVAQNARVAGGQVTIGPGASISGNVSAAGGEIRLEGRVDGYVQAAGGRVYVDGPIGGDVNVTSGEVELGPNAHIAGRLRYASDKELQQAPGARVQGGIERRPSRSGWPIPGNVERQVGGRGSWIWTFGLMLLAAVLVAVLPGVSARIAATLQGHPGKSLLVGFGILIGVPVAAVMLLITLIGAPLALLVITLYFALLLVGYISTSVALGDWALRRVKPLEAGRKAWRIGATVLTVLVIGLVSRIPALGILVMLLALLAGIGALILLVLQWRSAAAAAAAAAAPPVVAR
jgi:cytoskeletal protein CcmA (bactofilin family)